MLFVSFFMMKQIFFFIYLFSVFTVVILICELKFVSMTSTVKSEDCSLYCFGLYRVQSDEGLNPCFLFKIKVRS